MFEQIKVQEQTKQAELKTKEAEYKAQAERAAVVSCIAAAPPAARTRFYCASLPSRRLLHIDGALFL